jgi:hypothetical protein
LRRIFGPKSEEDESWRKLRNDELHSLYSSPNIVGMIKARRMSWARHVTRMGRGEVLTGFWLGGSKVRDHWEDLGVGENNINLELRDIEIDRTNWIQLAQDRVQRLAFVNTLMTLRIP